MKILITGSSGLVGSALIPFLEGKGYKIVRVIRSSSPKTEKTLIWNLQDPISDLNPYEGFDAVIHLAGENIAALRWTKEKKRKIRDSRVNSTRYLSEAISQLSKPPKVFLCASAIGFYGNRGDEELDENSPPGKGFFPEVCQEWELSCDSARKKGIRVVNLRFGILLSEKGGALRKMLLPFKLGLGGVVGSGRQWMSWMSLEDVIRGIDFVMGNETIEGPVNFASPSPVTNREWTKTLGKILKRPTLIALPAFAAKMAFGEMAQWLLLASTRVRPEKLLNLGFMFQHTQLDGCFKRLLS